MFEWLFKFSSQRFADGELTLQSGEFAWIVVILMVAAAGLLAATYYWSNLYATNQTRAVSLAIRLIVLLLLFVPLLEPVLVSPDVVDDENFVAVLLDTSESMEIPDATIEGSSQNNATRLESARRVLLGDGGLASALDEHFQVRYYGFDSSVRRVDSLESAAAIGTRTDLTAVLDRVQNDFRGVPLSGVVVLTDGGDNSDTLPINKAEELGAADVPVYAVGIGRESLDAEREILDVSVSKAIEQNTGAEIDVKVRSWGRETGTVEFSILQGEQPVFSERRALKGDGRIDQLTFFFEPDRPGAAEYTIRVEPLADEHNTFNNELEMLIDTRADTTRVLYFEGALRQDFKFIKRALEDDQVIDFVSVSRTGTGKYYRQGIRNASELSGGFPTERDELYQFKAVVFGDIEASNFGLDQLRMLEEYVRVRGGGFLMLGGRSSFAEGDYWNTPLADVLPVTLDPSRATVLPPTFTDDAKPPAEQGYRFEPTPAGLENPILKLTPDPGANRTRWATMPGLTSINYLGAPKAAAVVLAQKPSDNFGKSEPLLVTQRYGRGRATALATASTWRWQMLLDSEDQRHERFWRQLIRWQAAEAPDRVNISIDNDHPEPDQPIALGVEAFTPEFRMLEGADVRGTITDPFGTEQPFEFREELARPGSYTAEFVPRDEGIYSLTAAAVKDGSSAGTQQRSFLVRKTRREYADAVQNRQLLEDVARASGGGYFTPEDASRIPEILRGRKTQTTVYESDYVWDAPALWLAIVLLLSFEWWYRRRKGMA